MAIVESKRINNCGREFSAYMNGENGDSIPFGSFAATGRFVACLVCKELRGETIDPEVSMLWPCTYEEAHTSSHDKGSNIYCHRTDCDWNNGLPKQVENAYGEEVITELKQGK